MLDRFRLRINAATQPAGRWWLDVATRELAWLRDVEILPGLADATPEGASLELTGPTVGLVLWWEHQGSGALGGLLWRGGDRMDALNLVPLVWHYRPDLPVPLPATHDREVAAAATRAWSEALKPIVPQVLAEEPYGGADWGPIRTRWHDHLRARAQAGG
jgi:hypothetical protein